MINSLLQFATTAIDQAKNTLQNTAVAIGAPITGSAIGIFFREIIPVLTVASLITGIVLGILSYRLKRKYYQNNEQRKH
ncbi:hypothetical protein [Draconibacterium sp.]|uniref:hypothetical protein n=1 Tax=Draconibacterium sp. TaxID=1965318 RepID=UPI00356A918F